LSSVISTKLRRVHLYLSRMRWPRIVILAV
jgi:hypothetical protein